MAASIFRKVSLDRLSSPEQLDQILRVTSMRAWLVLATALALVATLMVWGLVGTVVSTASGTGVIVRRGGVLNVVSNGSGILLDVEVQPGDTVKAHQVIAHIAQPALVQQLHGLEAARNEALQNRGQSQRIDEASASLKLGANARQVGNNKKLIEEYESRIELVDQQIATENSLYSKGLVTHQQVLDLQQKKADLADQIASTGSQLKQLEADRYAMLQVPEQDYTVMTGHMSEIDRQIAFAKHVLDSSEQVVSPYSGQVLEIKVLSGSSVATAEPILSIQSNEKTLEVLAYVPSALAKDVQGGMDAEISPTNVKREEYGFLKGHVSFVADYPATPAAMMRNFENDTLVRTLAADGAVTEIIVQLTSDASTTTGFSWSSSRGPNQGLTSGTLCQIDVVTKHEHPIALLFPQLYAKFSPARKQSS